MLIFFLCLWHVFKCRMLYQDPSHEFWHAKLEWKVKYSLPH
uniref:Uncharacterized protein n=1 Tax=Rhizophora mucronata TaxID=61149 RepID=A0A2P2PGG6_RHIMU